MITQAETGVISNAEPVWFRSSVTGGVTRRQSDTGDTRSGKQLLREELGPIGITQSSSTSSLHHSRDHARADGFKSEAHEITSSLQKLEERWTRPQGSLSFGNAIGRLFLKLTEKPFDRLKQFPNDEREVFRLVGISNDCSASLSPYSECGTVFGKLSNILSRHLASELELDFEHLRSSCESYFPSLSEHRARQTFLRVLNSRGYSSMPDLDPMVFHTDDEEV